MYGLAPESRKQSDLFGSVTILSSGLLGELFFMYERHKKYIFMIGITEYLVCGYLNGTKVAMVKLGSV
jgi:hypothetical protein